MHVAFTLLARRHYYVEIIGPVRDFVKDKCISAVNVAILPFLARKYWLTGCRDTKTIFTLYLPGLLSRFWHYAR